MTTRVPIRYGGTGANNAADARAALGVLANTGGTIDGDLNITGNLIVSGNTTTLNVETLQVEDSEIVLNFGATTATLNAGIIVNRGSEANVFVRWNEDANTWGWSDDGNTFYSFDTALTAYGQANLAYDQANTAYGQANDAYAAANTANSNALDAYAQANSAYNRANTAANTTSIWLNDALVTSQSNLNFGDTATANVNVAANVPFFAYGKVSVDVNVSAIAANTIMSNTFVSKSGDTMTGNLVLSNATINTSTANISTIETSNNLILKTTAGSFANVKISPNNSNVVEVSDYGVTFKTNELLVWDQTGVENVYFLVTNSANNGGNNNGRFVGINTRYPTSNLHVVGNANITLGINTTTVNATTVNASTFLTSTGANVYLTSISAYDQANDAYAQANSAYDQANSAYGQANDAYAAANTANSNALAAYGQANDAYSAANTANSQANLAYDQANTSYGQANLAYAQANSAYDQANTANSQANLAYDQANTAYGQANDAYTAANSAANTVRVSQNSGSTLSAKQLNFVNTANVTITVTDSGDGNANVEIFSAAGGGGGAANVEIKNEGSTITTAVTSIDFVGSAVNATANGSNVTVSITGTGGGGSNTIIGSDLFTSVNADANLTYTLSEAVPGTNYVFVVKNGISLAPGVDYVVEPDYQTLRVIESGAANDSIEVRYFTPLSAVLIPNTTIVIDSNTVTSQTNTFFLTSNVTDITLLTVTKNGLFLTPNSHFTLSDNNTVTLTTVAEVDDELVFRYFRDQGIDEVSNNSVSSVFTANGVSNTYFMNSFALDANNVLVTIDGVVLTPGVDYSVSGPVLTINYVPAANSVIESRTITGGGDGSPATLGFYRSSFVSDGNTINFTLGQAPYDEDNCLVFVDRVLQRNSEYNVSATTLTFTGAPDANAVVDVFVTNYLATNKALIKTGDTMTGNLNVAATLITQNVEPAANITYDLGTSTKRFKDLWLSNSTIHLGEATISANGGNIVVPSIQTSSGINVESVLADAYNQANSAFSAANNRVLKAGDTMTGELNVANNLVVTGNVGIGTTTPGTKLDVRPGVYDYIQVESATHSTLTGLSAGIAFSRGSDGSGKLGAIFGWDNGGLAIAARGGIVFAAGGESTYSATNERMRIFDGGSVAIGTTSAPGRLTVGNATASDNNSLVLNRGVKPSIGAPQVALLSEWNGIGTAESLTFMADAGYKFLDDTGTTEWMRILSSGNIGIGTVTPVTSSLTGALTVYKLHGSDTVGNVPSVTGQPYSDNQSNLYLFGRNAGITIVSKNTEGGSLIFADDDSRNRGAIEYGHTTDVMTLSTAGSAKVTILSGGSVGIGTTNPAALLDLTSESTAQQYVDVLRLKTSSSGDYHPSILFENNRNNVVNRAKISLDSATGEGTGNLTLLSNSISLRTSGITPVGTSIRLNIDASGAITTPAQPSFMARRTSGFTLTVATVLVYDSELGDRGSNYNTSNGRFTAPVGGYYFFKAHVQPVTAGVSVNVNFWVNGSATAYASMGTTNLYARGDIGNEIVLPLNANDYVEVVVFVSSSCGFDNHGIFCGYLIG